MDTSHSGGKNDAGQAGDECSQDEATSGSFPVAPDPPEGSGGATGAADELAGDSTKTNRP